MEKKRQMSAIDVYQSVVYKWGNLMLVTAAMCASLIFLLFDILGMLSFNVVAISSFVAMDVIYYIFCIWMVKTSFDQDKYLKEGRLKLGKIFTSFVVIVQWNCILYMVPSRTFWGFLFFFMILIAFYLDIKMTIIDGMTCISSLVVSWFVNGYNLPIDDEIFITDFLLMVVGISLSMIGMIVFILFMTKFLVNAKKDELEENNNRVLNVLDKVNSFTSQLGEASKSLVSTAQNQSASTEELSCISQGLLESCSKMLQKSEQSQDNLISLQDSSRSVGEKMQVVNAVSKELTLISQTNENSLNELIGMSEEVKKSTSKTKDVTEKLLKESSEIGSTLGIINEIAEDINLLALNASIEAARAGEAGKGFAVVAQEVGDLAENTKKSLESVGEMVNAIQIGTTDVSNFMNENAEQLLEQNKVILETVEGIRNMMELLKKSVNAIEEADKLCISQSEVIKHTVNINKDIAEGINSENKEFSNIASMVESNNKEVMGLSNQVDSINSMINELEKLLDK